MKLLSKERQYVLKLLQCELERQTKPESATLKEYYDSPHRTEGDLRYRDRLESARSNKAKILRSIIEKLRA